MEEQIIMEEEDDMDLTAEEVFEGLVGKESVKKKLNFYIEAFNKTSSAPYLLFAGGAGLGKTEFATAFAKRLNNKNGAPRPFLELNCSTIKNNESFFETIFMPIIAGNEVTILFDEAHALPQDLTMAFLTIFNTSAKGRCQFTWRDEIFTFDFSKQTYLFATTETDQLFPPLKDRLTTIDFEPYTPNHLGKILKLNAKGIDFKDDSLDILAETLRGNARNAVKRAQELSLFCEARNTSVIGNEELKDFFDTLGVLPYGISNTERQILDILKEHGSCTLATLSAKTGLSGTSLRRDHELYLLRKSFMIIDGTRQITSLGRKCLKRVGELV